MSLQIQTLNPKQFLFQLLYSTIYAADYDFTLMGKEKELQAAVTALSKLTDGSVNVGVGKNSKSVFEGLEDITFTKFLENILQEM